MQTTQCFKEFEMNATHNYQNSSKQTSTGIVPPPSTANGYVYDEFGNPLSDVNVFLEGNVLSVSKNVSIGSATNSKGFFSIPNVPFNTTINVSHIGFEKHSYSHRNSMPVKVVLVSKTETLDEVLLTNKKTNAFAWFLGAIAFGTIIYKVTKKKGSGLAGAGASKKRSNNVVKVTI